MTRRPCRTATRRTRVFAVGRSVFSAGSTAGSIVRMMKVPFRWLAVFTVMCVVTLLLFTRLPGGFLPSEDQGYFMVNYDAPVGATMQRTEIVVNQAEAYLRKQPQVRNIITLLGYNAYGQSQGAALS